MRRNESTRRVIVTVLTLIGILAPAAGTAIAGVTQHAIATPFDGEPEVEGSTATVGVDLLGATSVSETATASNPTDVEAALIAGADYLKGAQADITEDNAGNGADDEDPDDGGWDWRLTEPKFDHSANPSSKNLYGATAMGLYYAYLETEDATYMTAMADAAGYMIGDPNIRSAADLIFLMRFQDLNGVEPSTYQDSAKEKFDARISTHGSATGLADHIRDVRAGQGYENGIIPWDIGAWAVAAEMLADRYPSDAYDYAEAADDIAEVIYQDSFNDSPGYFDLTSDKNMGWDADYENKNYWWFSLGISGLIDAFKAADVHTDQISSLVDLLLDSQYTNGAFSYCYGANPGDEDWQSTAYGAMSLAGLDQATYQTEINHACYWLSATQDDDSGAWIYSSGNHYPEIGGESTSALYFASPVMLWLEPSDGWVEMNGTTTVDVMMTGSGFNGVEFDLTYDDALLSVDSVQKGSMWDGYTTNPVQNEWGEGTIEFGAFLTQMDTTLDVSEAQVATITFAGDADGISDLRFSNVIVSDLDGRELVYQAQDGTLEVYGRGIIEGRVELQGRFVAGGDTLHHAGATVTLTGGPDGGFTFTGQTDQYGKWTISDVVEGSYNVSVVNTLYLTAERTGTITVEAEGTADAGFVKLLGGDVNDLSGDPPLGNNKIGTGDAAVVAGTFGLSYEDTDYDDNGDINDDNTVNILDCSILGGNYGKEGPVNW